MEQQMVLIELACRTVVEANISKWQSKGTGTNWQGKTVLCERPMGATCGDRVTALPKPMLWNALDCGTKQEVVIVGKTWHGGRGTPELTRIQDMR